MLFFYALISAITVQVWNGTTRKPVPNQRVVLLIPPQQGQAMPTFVDTAITNAQGVARLNPPEDAPPMMFVGTRWHGQMTSQPVQAGQDTVQLTVFDPGEGKAQVLGYHAIAHPLEKGGFFLLEALELGITPAVRLAQLDPPLRFLRPEGAEVGQVMPQGQWETEGDSILVFRGPLDPSSPVVQIQWVWQTPRPRVEIRRTFSTPIHFGEVLVRPPFQVRGLGKGDSTRFQGSSFLQYALPMNATEVRYTLQTRPLWGAGQTRWVLGSAIGIVLALVVLALLARRRQAMMSESAPE